MAAITALGAAVSAGVGFAVGFRLHGSVPAALAAFALCIAYGFAFEVAVYGGRQPAGDHDPPGPAAPPGVRQAWAASAGCAGTTGSLCLPGRRLPG